MQLASELEKIGWKIAGKHTSLMMMLLRAKIDIKTQFEAGKIIDSAMGRGFYNELRRTVRSSGNLAHLLSRVQKVSRALL